MIKIDQEFQSLIPELSSEEYTQLEKNIIKDGIRDALVVWKTKAGEEILIDGHNRKRIADAHPGIRYDIKYVEFPDREAAKRWIILNQFGRRNLSAYDRSVLALKLKPLIAEKAKENMLATQNNENASAFQKSDKQVNTAKELAKAAGVSHDTIHKVETIENSNDERLKEQVRAGDITINKAYHIVKGDPPNKSMSKLVKEMVEDAKQQHQEFEEAKAENGTVSFSDIKVDKENKKLIARDTWQKCMKMGSAIESVILSREAGDIDLGLVASEMPEEDLQILKEAIKTWAKYLSQIYKEVFDE